MSYSVIRGHRTDFSGDEAGGITILNLFLFLCMLLTAGLAIDVNNMVQARAQLQGAADAAGHAALYWRWRHSETDSVAKAIEVAEANMPPARFGNVLGSVDVAFGSYNPATGKFNAQTGNNTAVEVVTRREASNANGLTTFLMKLIGIDTFSFRTTSVWAQDQGWCPGGQGFFAVGIVDIQSNNSFHDGFCIHSQTHVEVQQNNTFDPDTSVTMPDEADLVVPASGLSPTKNPGLADALGSVSLNLVSFFNDVPSLMARYEDPYDSVNASLTDTMVYTKTIKTAVKATDITPGAINILDCKGKTLTIDKDEVLKDAVIVTPCEVKFSQGAAIENATLIVLDTGSKSVSAPSGFRVGAVGYCATGNGGATILTLGDVKVASGFESYGANIISKGDISVTANANGLGGVNMMAAGRIDATSNGDLGNCGRPVPEPFQIPVFRMVK